jgi:hypothetical protein
VDGEFLTVQPQDQAYWSDNPTGKMVIKVTNYGRKASDILGITVRADAVRWTPTPTTKA